MLDKINYIEYNGEQYPVVFNFNVAEALQEKYGSVDGWSDLVSTTILNRKTNEYEHKEPNFGAVKYFFHLAINEGIDIENEKNGSNRPFISERQAGRIISNIRNAVKTMQDTVANQVGTSSGEEKNVTAEQSQSQ